MAVTDDADIRRIAHDASTKWEPNLAVGDVAVYVDKDSLPSPSTHMSDELYGFYTRALEQSKRGILYFNGRTFAKKFAHMGHSTAYRRARELEMSGWFELIRKGGNDADGRPLCTIYRIRNLSQWETWRSQCPEAPAICQTLQTRTQGCAAWLQGRLASGPVFSDVLEKERLSLKYSRKVYRDARAKLNVKWSQKNRRRVSWMGSNGLIIGKK